MIGTRTLVQALAVLAVSTAAIAQQAPTTTPRTQQPNGATTPQVPRDMGPATEEQDAPGDDRESGTGPETARDISESEPETARDVSDTEPETARDTRDSGPETARDISDGGPETARDISDTGPETARDISDRGPETARDDAGTGEPEPGSNTRVATAESASAADVVTPETDRDRGVAAPVTGREDDPNAPGNDQPPDPNAVRSMAQLQQDDRNGCWVRLYDAPNFSGADVTLVGAASMRAIDGTYRSIEVGPAATVTTYRAENFGGSIQRFDPGLKVPDLSASENNEEFGSLRVSCPRAAPATPSRG